jgi:hypothetical protein
VDKHAEARLAEPLHAGALLFRCFAILDGRHWMSARDVVAFSLHLTQTRQRSREYTTGGSQRANPGKRPSRKIHFWALVSDFDEYGSVTPVEKHFSSLCPEPYQKRGEIDNKYRLSKGTNI